MQIVLPKRHLTAWPYVYRIVSLFGKNHLKLTFHVPLSRFLTLPNRQQPASLYSRSSQCNSVKIMLYRCFRSEVTFLDLWLRFQVILRRLKPLSAVAMPNESNEPSSGDNLTELINNDKRINRTCIVYLP